MLGRLSKLSVERHFDAYADIESVPGDLDLAVLAVPLFYAVEAQGVFLFPVALDGSRRWYDLPPSPPISDEIGPAPRWRRRCST